MFLKEASTGIVNLEDRDPYLIMKMLECIYKNDDAWRAPAFKPADSRGLPSTPDVPAPEATNSAEKMKSKDQIAPSPAASNRTLTFNRFHVSMYAYGDYFGVHVLKARTKEHFRVCFSRKITRKFFERAVDEVYNFTPSHDRELRDLMTELTLGSLSTFREGPFPILGEELLKHQQEFASDLCIALLKRGTKRGGDEAWLVLIRESASHLCLQCFCNSFLFGVGTLS